MPIIPGVEDQRIEPLDEFDIFVRQENALEKADPSPDEFDIFVRDELDSEEALSSSLDQALPKSPDESAKIRELSKKSGFPEEAVAIDKNSVAQQVRKDEITKIVSDKTPVVKNLLANPSFAQVAHDEVEALTAIETKSKDLGVVGDILIGFERGDVTRQLGFLGARKRAGEDVDAKIKELEKKLPELRGSGGFLEAAANAIGTFAKGIPEVIAKGQASAIGAATAATIAGQLGPQAALPEEVFTVPGAAAIGFSAGSGAEVFRQSAIIEGGLIYTDLLKEGVAEEIARPVSEVAGFINGVLEVVSFGIIAAPIKKAISKLVQKKIAAQATKSTVAGAVKDFGLGLAGVAVKETGTEVLQETSNIAASEVGKALDSKEKGFESRFSTEEGRQEIVEQYSGVIVETMKAMTVLGLPGASINFAADIQRASRAEQNEEVMKDVSKRMQELALTKRDPEAVIDLQVKLLAAQGVEDIFIPVEKLKEFVQADETRSIEDMGLAEQVKQAEVSQGDVRLSQRQYAEFFMLSKDFPSVAENIRLGEGEKTGAEAKEFESSELPKELEKLAAVQEKALADASITLEKKAPTPVPTEILRDKSKTVFESDVLNRETIEKTASVEEFEKLKKSIKEEGIKDPVTLRVDEEGKVNVVDGANRLLAAEELGIKDVPAVFTEDSIKSGAAQKFVEQAAPAKKEISKIEQQVREDIELAEYEAGLKALFESAEEAGLPPKQYESYLTAVQQTADGRVKRETLRREKAALKEATSELSKATIEMRRKVQEEVEQRPEYRALDIIKAGGRIDQEAIFSSDFLGEPFDLDTLNNFPKVGNKVIYGPMKAGEDVFHPDVLADVVGLTSGDELLKLLYNSRPIKDVIIEEADARIAQEKGELPKKVQDLQRAIEALYEDDTAKVLAMELNALRVAQKRGALKTSLIKAAAKQEIQKHSLRNITPLRFSRAAKRFGQLAGKLLRKGDRAAAAEAKLLQIINFHMTQEAYEVRNKRAEQEKFLKKAAKKPKLGGKKAQDSLPPDYSTAIRGILHSYGLGGAPLPAGFDIVAFQQREFKEGVAFELPPPGDPEVDFKDMPLHEFNRLVQQLKTIRGTGIAKTKLQKAIRGQQVQEVVNQLVLKMSSNLDPRKARTVKDPVSGVEFVPVKEEVLNKVQETWREWGPDLATLGLNMDTLLRELDGWEDLGLAYESIKGPIDDAITNGYREGQVGYNRRHKKMLQDIEDLLSSHYTLEERAKFHRAKRYPGVSLELTHKQVLAILLNSGNAENIAALTGGEKRALTASELDALRNAVEEKDLDFAQAVWDYIDSYWEEIVESTVRRKNFKPEKVIAQPFTVKGKTYAGGYYFLAYDGDSLAMNDVAGLDEIHDNVIYGAHVSQFTRDDHIHNRVKNSGRMVDLDPFLIESHMQRVIYDLEVGEAVSDSFKILYHRDFRAAFERMGRQNLWRAMDLWFRGTITGEIRSGNPVEKFFRHIRSGISIVALGYNFSVAALQPLGMIPAAIVVGPARMAKALMGTLAGLATKGPKILNEIGSITPTMEERSYTSNKDLNTLKKAFNKTWSDTGLKGRAKKLIADNAFYALIKMQQIADVVVWQAAYSKGMELFHNDDIKAKRYADRVVIRTQGSGNFQERTPFEQGTISKRINQTEMVKAFSLFMVYFAAKTNVVYEAIRKNNKKASLKGAARLASDLALAFVYETILVMMIKGQFPDDDGEDWAEKIKKVSGEVVSTAMQGVPVLREIPSSIRGFAAGGTMASFSKDVAKSFEKFSFTDFDLNSFLALAKVLGIATHNTLAGQTIRTGKAINKEREGEEVEVIEYVLGPKFEK